MKLRFAPSPTGYLHVGNARLAIANALFARRHGAAFLLRIDDTDVARSRPEYEAGIEADLRWLGLGWDEMAHQSQRLDRYALAIEALKASGRLYPCFESEAELAAKREARLRARKPPIYDRAMLRMTPEQRARAEANGKTPYWRFKLSDGSRKWRDLVMGDCSVKLTAISDPVLVRADGTILYTLASVVDDIELDVTHIVRGEDHITNTGVQLDIIEALGARPGNFTFAHLPLLLDEGGGKLSKRFDSLSLRALRNDGVEPDAVVSYLSRIGSADDPTPMTLEEATAGYDLSRMSRSAARFDMQQLLGLNRRMLHDRAFEDVRDRLPDGATEAFWNVIRGNIDLTAEIAHWWQVAAGDIVPPNLPDDRAFLRQALDTLPPEPWGAETWKQWTGALRQVSGRSGKGLFRPLRLALTGEEAGPELHALIQLMGHARVAGRLTDAARE
ncbi:glutamyl-tRNA synthetase [Neoasaia chiangmaiensis NBRC 101099]|uniref:Glutamate--tRNA ligase n=1 Tax=Neoasaia chiangmaiensis TaxID=320497 RepID=A0A1U9KN20_9PROT|nr:glutamate--tRNA ligase [Neoasaia chiangmaiensis]AQS87201.1 glutamate--tRNA ligase [Neoasaia chiangmaiensis]GBR38332.1 glutamyl-tRNA synthetase [Neoasaia chiangmaiensis NBRC 101099]GEN15946.1 glutamate--tRNA ligase 2 [Neoasaia chiangmaiensis]